MHVLPFMGKDELYQQFNLDEPWNSPHNLELLAMMPSFYTDYNGLRAGLPWKTRIQRPVGKGFILDPELSDQDPAKDIALKDITDGTADTVLVIQVAKSAAVPWTRPADWDGDSKKLIDDGEPGGKQIWFTYADGSVDSLKTPVSAKFLNAILTRNGGEIIVRENKLVRQNPAVAENRFSSGLNREPMTETEYRDRFQSPTPAAPSRRVERQLDSRGKWVEVEVTPPEDPAENDPPIRSQDASRTKSDKDVPVFAGRTFESWMKTARNDHQLRAKFVGLTAAVALAHDGSKQQQQVMNEITNLLRTRGVELVGGNRLWMVNPPCQVSR